MTDSRDFAQAAVRRAWLKQLLGPINEARWDELTRELFAWQFAQVPAYRRLCQAREITPENLASWRDIPAVPQQLFKQTLLYAHGSTSPAAIYVTSGTTTGKPGRQHLLATDIYRTVSTEAAHRSGFLDHDLDLHFLAPSPGEASYSSLSAMFGYWQKAARQTGPHFWIRHGHLEAAHLRETLLSQIKARKPVAICGTAFSFVHLIDAWADLPPLRLPAGSRLLETGGFKGRSREVSKPELYAQLARTFGVRENAIWNEYGMSELSSQAYAHGAKGLHHAPPWTRVLVCDPVTGREVPVGKRGMVRWIDLANTDSVLALQTLDLAERTTAGFRLIGRISGSEPRGCSLSAEDLAVNARLSSPMP